MPEVCLPVTIYGVFMTALVLFDLYMRRGGSAMRNTAYGILGAIFLFVLCAAGMDFVAWGMLLLPIIFYLFLFAIILFDRSFLSVTHKYSPSRIHNRIFPGNGGESNGCGEETCDPEPDTCTEDC